VSVSPSPHERREVSIDYQIRANYAIVRASVETSLVRPAQSRYPSRCPRGVTCTGRSSRYCPTRVVFAEMEVPVVVTTLHRSRRSVLLLPRDGERCTERVRTACPRNWLGVRRRCRNGGRNRAVPLHCELTASVQIPCVFDTSHVLDGQFYGSSRRGTTDRRVVTVGFRALLDGEIVAASDDDSESRSITSGRESDTDTRCIASAVTALVEQVPHNPRRSNHNRRSLSARYSGVWLTPDGVGDEELNYNVADAVATRSDSALPLGRGIR